LITTEIAEVTEKNFVFLDADTNGVLEMLTSSH